MKNIKNIFWLLHQLVPFFILLLIIYSFFDSDCFTAYAMVQESNIIESMIDHTVKQIENLNSEMDQLKAQISEERRAGYVNREHFDKLMERLRDANEEVGNYETKLDHLQEALEKGFLEPTEDNSEAKELKRKVDEYDSSEQKPGESSNTGNKK